MKTNHTDEQIQAVADSAFEQLHKDFPNLYGSLALRADTPRADNRWKEEAPARLALARGLLARLIAAAREGQPASQPAEIPWTEWHGGECPLKDEEVAEWERKYRTGKTHTGSKPSNFCWTHDTGASDIIAYRVTKWRGGFGPAVVDWKAKYEEAEAELARIVAAAHEAGWNGVENSKDLAQFIKDQEAALEKWSNYIHLEDHDRIVKGVQDRAKASIAEARQEGLSTLRPIAEAGEVPAGCVRWFTKHGPAAEIIANTGGPDTHFADILLPEDKALADEPKPAEPVKPWTPAVGNVVTKANPVQDMALGGQMYWRDLARQLAEVWWKCHNIGASLQHGDIDTDVSFSVVCEQHGGQVFHADTPQNAWLKAEKWIMSPDRENFPSTTLQLA